MEYTAVGLAEVESLAKKILSDFKDKKVLTFYGEMGAGKTTLIKSICRFLNVTDSTSSPTFSIVNEYLSSENKKIYHFDFYRLKNLQEALDIGCEEYFYSGNYCFIEWPQIVESILPDDVVKLHIERNGNTMRVVGS